MSNIQQIVQPISELPPTTQWFAVQTKPRHESRVAERIGAKGIPTFLPLITETHRWSDRRKKIHTPLFSCYVFVCLESQPESRLAVLRTPGVFGLVGPNNQPTAIPECEIDNIKALMASAEQFESYPFLKVGQRVRMRGGALDGVEGILVSRNNERGLIVSVDALQRSLCVRVEGYDVEPA